MYKFFPPTSAFFLLCILLISTVYQPPAFGKNSNILPNKVINEYIYNISNKNHYSDKKKSLDHYHISFKDAYIKPTIGKSKITVAYMKIFSTKKDRIIEITSPSAKKIETHYSFVDNKGVMKMRRISNPALSPSKPLILKPGGYHFMIMGLEKPLKEGEALLLKVFFASGIKLDLELIAISHKSKKHIHH